MTTAKIVYASMTGNNEEIAEILDEELQELGIQTDMTDISFTDANELLDYDLNLMVLYTYGEGDMPDEVLDFYEDLKSVDLSGKVFATMGSGDTFYEEHFCETVDDFDKLMIDRHGIRAIEPLKINLEPESEDIENIAHVAQAVVAKFNDEKDK